MLRNIKLTKVKNRGTITIARCGLSSGADGPPFLFGEFQEN